MATINYKDSQVTLLLNGRTYQDLIEGDAVTVSFPNPRTSRVNGMQSVSIHSRSDADVCDLKVSVVKHTQDDKALNDSMRNQDVIDGSLRYAYEENGVSKREVITLEGGSVTDQPELAFNSTDANNTVTYTIQFRTGKRLL